MELERTSIAYKRAKTASTSLPVFCFAILYAIYLMKRIYIVQSSEFFLNMLDWLEWPIYLFAFLNAVFKTKYRIRELVVIFGAGVVFLMGFSATGYAELLKATLLIVALRKSDYRELFGVMYRILVASIVFTVLLYLLGISDAGVQRRGYTALGYAQANSVGYILMVLVLLTIARKGRLSAWNIVVLGFINFLGFILADSRTGFLLACVALIFANHRFFALIKRNRFIQRIILILPMLLMLVTVLTAMLYERSAVIQGIDALFSSRILLNSFMLTDKGITLLGQMNEYHGMLQEAVYNPITQRWINYMTIDSTYTSLLVEWGILATIITMCAYYCLMKKLFKCEAVELAYVMSILCIYGLTESAVISIYVSFPFILLLNENIEKQQGKRALYDS